MYIAIPSKYFRASDIEKRTLIKEILQFHRYHVIEGG